MKHLDSRVWGIARKLGCRVEPSDPGYDLYCGGRRLLLVWVTRGSGYITWERYRSAQRYWPDALLVRGSEVVATASWAEVERAMPDGVLAGYRVRLVPGRLGAEARIVGDPRDVERIMECVKRVGAYAAARELARLCP